MFNRTKTIALAIALLAATASAQPTNRALNIPITPLTNTVQGAASMVTDGSFETGVWYSYQGNPTTCSFTIDLGSVYTISSVVFGQAQVYGYTVSSSLNGETWTTRSQVDYEGSVANTVTLPVNGAYTARYFKYSAYANWMQYVGVSEFEVYGTSAPTVPVLTPWALAGLALLVVGCGAFLLRPRTA
jgi:hypothetical protein